MQSSTAVAPHQCNNQQHNIYNIYSQHIFFMEDVTDKEGGRFILIEAHQPSCMALAF